MSGDARDSGDDAIAPPRPRRWRRPSLAMRVDASVVHDVPDQVVVPADCACCGAGAVRGVREARGLGSRALVVPYCAICHEHVSVGSTRRFAAFVSTLLFTMTLVGGLPLLWQPPSGWVLGVVVAVVGLLPSGLAVAFRGAVLPGHASNGRAVFFRRDGALACTRVDWGDRLALSMGASAVHERLREPRLSRWTALVPLLALGSGPPLFELHFPVVRVVNVSGQTLEVFADDRDLGSVDATSVESQGAGVEVRIPVGQRRLRAVNADGKVVDETTAIIQSGADHLYAPASDGRCFWIETTGYGKAVDFGTRVDPLGAPPQFWTFAEGVDLWFAPTPAADDEHRFTGGTLRAVRQARCDESPGVFRGGAAPPSTAAPFATEPK